MPYPQGTHLTPRDLKIISTVGRYKLLTTSQLLTLYFPTGKYHTAVRRLATLTKDGFLSRVFSHPTAHASYIGHPAAVYYWTPQNQQRLKAHLEDTSRAGAWDDFALLAATNNKNNEYSQLYLKHETSISDFFLALEAACQRRDPADHQQDAGVNLVFWERTSPLSKDIGEKLKVEITHKTRTGTTTEKQILPFNPDAFFCLKLPSGYSFFFLELDNNTSTTERFRKKLFAYLAYREQQKFSPVLARYNDKYQLGISNEGIKKAPFRVLTLTPDKKRRNTLFLDSLKLKSYKMLLFASLTETAADTALTPVWMRGKEYAPIAEQEKKLPPDIDQAVKARWCEQQLAKMPRVSLTD